MDGQRICKRVEAMQACCRRWRADERADSVDGEISRGCAPTVDGFPSAVWRSLLAEGWCSSLAEGQRRRQAEAAAGMRGGCEGERKWIMLGFQEGFCLYTMVAYWNIGLIVCWAFTVFGSPWCSVGKNQSPPLPC